MTTLTPTTPNRQRIQQNTPTLAHTPITVLKGIGASLALTFERLGISTVQDLLFHLPIRYMDRTRVTPIGKLRTDTSVVIQGKVRSTRIMFGKRRSLAVVVRDETGEVTLRFYHFTAAQKNNLSEGAQIRCYGDPRLGATGLEFYHPEYDLLDKKSGNNELDEFLTPIYPLTEGITQGRIRKFAEAALDLMRTVPPKELLPREINEQFNTACLSDALAYVHAPPADACVEQLLEGEHPYQQRLAFEELLAHNLAVQQVRDLAKHETAPDFKPQPALQQQLKEALPFDLTNAQKRVVTEIQKDLAINTPMLRMVQGDVGSGKTLVACMAALNALGNGFQVALVAPTEILAEQHRNNFSRWLEPLGFNVAWLVGKLTAAQKRKANEAIASGEAQMVVGTHALFQDSVEFARLGLVIIDEQHRFGVHQRLSIRQKGKELLPHQLVMTATPIPRTLAMTAYANLDISVIDELPPGRKPINTVLLSQSKRDGIIERIRQACLEGRQAYWVCTLVEDSETLAAAAAEATMKLLEETLTELNIGLVHGRLKSKEKDTVMAAFKNGELHLLVATTVIEVGVDVPNASLMIIENPERLGLAQLHQLRGRVGRGEKDSHCVLLYKSPLSNQAKERLSVLRETTDGFLIAEKDLLLRGPGELLGTQQTGDMNFRLANLQRDGHLLELIQETAEKLRIYHPDIIPEIIKRWFAGQQQYASV